jgi:hypothetical protein
MFGAREWFIRQVTSSLYIAAIEAQSPKASTRLRAGVGRVVMKLLAPSADSKKKLGFRQRPITGNYVK